MQKVPKKTIIEDSEKPNCKFIFPSISFFYQFALQSRPFKFRQPFQKRLSSWSALNVTFTSKSTGTNAA